MPVIPVIHKDNNNLAMTAIIVLTAALSFLSFGVTAADSTNDRNDSASFNAVMTKILNPNKMTGMTGMTAFYLPFRSGDIDYVIEEC